MAKKKSPKKKVVSKKTVKKQPKKKAKPQNKRPAKQSVKKPRKLNSSLKRYNVIQKALKDYCDHNNLKLGKEFNLAASYIYQNNKQYPIKFVVQNIEQLYLNYIASKTPAVAVTGQKRNFDESFPFWKASETLLDTKFDNVIISVSFTDPADISQSFYHKGDSASIVDYIIDSGMHRYLRVYYDESPHYAMFVINKTDDETYVDYIVDVGGVSPVTVTPATATPVVPPIIPAVTTPKAAAGDLELEKQKEKNIQEEIAKIKEQNKLEKSKKDKIKQYNIAVKNLDSQLKRKLITKKEYTKYLKKLNNSMYEGGQI